MEDEDFFGAVNGLERGQALITSAFAVIRKYNGRFMGVHVGCDEPLIYELRNSRHAVEWMDRWKMRLGPSAADIVKQMPNDMDEVEHVIQLLTAGA